MMREYGDGLQSPQQILEFSTELLEATRTNFKDNLTVIFEKLANDDSSVSYNKHT